VKGEGEGFDFAHMETRSTTSSYSFLTASASITFCPAKEKNAS
jgi:hypothetical protein